jgi:hypothetical protein
VQPRRFRYKQKKLKRLQSKPSLGTADLDFELLAVTQQRGQTGIEQRTPVVAAKKGGEFVITISDSESGQLV